MNAQVAKQIGKLEQRLSEKSEAHQEKIDGYMAEIRSESNRHALESHMTHANLDKRITVVENWQGGVQSRLDQLIAAIDAHGLGVRTASPSLGLSAP